MTRILQLLGRSKAAKPAATDNIDGVLLDKIQTENVVQFGPQCVAMAAWNALGLTGLPEMLAIRITKTTKDRLYQTSDLILSHRKVLEQQLRHREAELFDCKRSIILYDLIQRGIGRLEKSTRAPHDTTP